MWTNLLLVLYCVLVVLASVAGGALPSRLRLTHTRMQLMMSFVAGLMLGVALLHMLPHAAARLPSLDWALEAALVGLLMMFFLIRIFHFHQHHAGEGEVEPLGDAIPPHHHDDHGPLCDHDHASDRGQAHSLAPGSSPRHAISWVGLALGLSLHTLIDGMALAAGVEIGASKQSGWGLFGLGTFLAVVLHKPLDAMSITTLMAAAGWPHQRQRLVNYSFAIMCPLGALLFWFGSRFYANPELLGLSLAFSAGVFLCISLGDLLPEVHFHTHDRGKLSAALLAGVGLAFLVGFIEPEHGHGQRTTPVPAPLQSSQPQSHNAPLTNDQRTAPDRAGK